MEQANWEDKIEKLKKVLDQWKRRDLTLMGKILIIKTLAISSLIFTSTMITLPNKYIKTINNILFGFIWPSRDRIKRNTLIGEKKDGGLKMVDFQSLSESMKAGWVLRILNSENNNWSLIPKYLFASMGQNNHLFNMTFTNIKSFPNIESFPLFYKEVIVAFNKSKNPDKPDKYHFINGGGSQNVSF